MDRLPLMLLALKNDYAILRQKDISEIPLSYLTVRTTGVSGPHRYIELNRDGRKAVRKINFKKLFKAKTPEEELKKFIWALLLLKGEEYREETVRDRVIRISRFDLEKSSFPYDTTWLEPWSDYDVKTPVIAGVTNNGETVGFKLGDIKIVELLLASSQGYENFFDL